jgi:excisionase family DNA binding protein
MYTITNAAKNLGVTRQWIYQLISKGALTTTTIGGVRFIVPDNRYRSIKAKRNGAK